MRRLEGKVALVTGGTSGIGAATVARLAADGAYVVFTGSNQEAAARVSEKTGAVFRPHRVEDAAGWPAVTEAILAQHGQLDIAFANAGIEAGDGSVETITIEGWNQLVAVNLTGVMLTAQAAVKAMRHTPGRGGAIVINSSMSAYRPMGNFIAYSTTKGALIALSKSVAIHCANEGTGIRCNSIHPGVVETDMIRTVIDRSPDPKAARNQFEGMAPLRRMAQVDEVAGLVAFLVSDEAAFISGAEYSIDGASTAGMMGV